MPPEKSVLYCSWRVFPTPINAWVYCICRERKERTPLHSELSDSSQKKSFCACICLHLDRNMSFSHEFTKYQRTINPSCVMCILLHYTHNMFLYKFTWKQVSSKYTMSLQHWVITSFLFLQYLVISDSFQFTRSSFITPPLCVSRTNQCFSSLTDGTERRAAEAPVMFLDGLKNDSSYDNKRRRKNDTTNLGNLVVPTVGVGTISWSSNSCKSFYVMLFV